MNLSRLLLTIILASTLGSEAVAAEYWVAPDGDDGADGTSRVRAWASPSRGQPTRLSRAYQAGDKHLHVYSTAGFLDRGRVSINGETRGYVKTASGAFELTEPFTNDFSATTNVFDADILDGNSFSPGDVINLVGGVYLDRPLDFCRSGSRGQPITYRSAPNEQAILRSTAFDRSPIRHLSNRRSARTKHVVLENLTVRNSVDGNHGAPGIDLFGVSEVLVRGCDVDISGRDINGDNNAIRLFDSNHVTVTGCRLRSRYANGIAAWATSDIEVNHTLIYESFHGVMAAGGRYMNELSIRNCTLYATNQHGGVLSDTPSTVTVHKSIIAQMPSADMPAVAGVGGGDHNCIWHAAKGYGDGWNGATPGLAGKHDIHVDPRFLSVNPANKHFLRIAKDSAVATAGENGSYLGALPPIRKPTPAAAAEINVLKFGAVGDGVHDDTDAVMAAIDAAQEGGKIVFPPTSRHYLVSKTLHIQRDHVHLFGPGATLKLKASVGRIHLIEVSGQGPASSIVEHVKIEGLTLDANYRRQPQQRKGGIPRGVWVKNAYDVLLKDLTVRDAYCGVTFGPNTRKGEAVDVTVTDWDHDAFGASGWGRNGGCTDVSFRRCKAVNAGRCVKAWEIEEGAQRIRLEDCLVENIGGAGTGFYVRHHEYRWPLLVDDVTFVRCQVRNISGAGFLITSVPGDHIRPFIRTRNVTLVDCSSDAPVTIACGVENVRIRGGRFDGVMAIGFEAHSKQIVDCGPKWPVRSISISDAHLKRLVVNARTGNPNGQLGDAHYPDYKPDIRLIGVSTSEPIEIEGDRRNVLMRESGESIKRP